MFSPTDVVVTVRQARNLLIKAKGGINNAYATIEFSKEKYATGAEKSLVPKWFTECTFSLPHGGVFSSKVAVTVCVYHKHHSKLGLEPDEFLGQAQILLSSLNSTNGLERARWYSLSGKKKDSKKERGEIEVAFRFLQSQKDAVDREQKGSPSTLRVLTSGFRSKLRRRSEDEDSGLGVSEGDTKPQAFGLGKGRSFENLSTVSIIDTDNHPFERSFRTNSTNSSPGAIVSARGSSRSLQANSNLVSNKAMSVEVLHRPDMKPPLSPRIHSESKGSGAGGGGKLVDRFKKKHGRNLSLPDSQLASMMGQLRKDDLSKSAMCINGSHLYVPGAMDSGNNSATASPEIKPRSSSMEDVSGKMVTKSRSSTPVNKNTSNSSRRHSMVTLEHMKQDQAKIATLYKPKNYYRLDVRELRKVSTIHEDATVSHQNMSREQLVALIQSQQKALSSKDTQIRHLEDYIDSLLLKVMTYTPHILEGSLMIKSTKTDKKLSRF